MEIKHEAAVSQYKEMHNSWVLEYIPRGGAAALTLPVNSNLHFPRTAEHLPIEYCYLVSSLQTPKQMLKGTPPETQGSELAQSWHLNSLFFLGLFHVLILYALCCWEAEVFRIPATGQLGSLSIQRVCSYKGHPRRGV